MWWGVTLGWGGVAEMKTGNKLCICRDTQVQNRHLLQTCVDVFVQSQGVEQEISKKAGSGYLTMEGKCIHK